MRINGESYSPDGKCSIRIEVDSREEIDKVKAAIQGAHWIMGNERGQLDTLPRFEEIKLIPDPIIAPFFEPTEQASSIPYRLLAKGGDEHDPSFYVQHIDGLRGDYARAVLLMSSAGFTCLRSRRLPNGTYWEIWYLGSKRFAKGPIQGMDTLGIRSWLFQEVQPGEVSLRGAHWGLAIDP